MTEERAEYSASDGRSMSKLEAAFLYHWRILAPTALRPVSEHRFCERKWKFDFAWPAHLVAVECEGGTWTGGRHTRGAGFEKDCIKYNRATADGWRVFRCTAGMLKRAPSTFIDMVRYALLEEN